MKKELIVKNGVSKVGGRFVAFVNGEKIISSKNEATAHLLFNRAMKKSTTSVSFAPVTVEPANKFHINKRFEFLNKAVRMVAAGVQSSVVISGSGGLGKSHSVKSALVQSGLRDLSSVIASSEEGAVVNRNRGFVFVKGFSTAKNLYRQLFENNDSIIVFDDCDSILKDPVAQNVLKAALDSYDTRIISWGAESRGDDDLPRSFIFTGRVIFITNMTMDRVDQAIRSRSITIDVSMTTEEMVDRMRVIAESEDFLPNIDSSYKMEALNFIDRNKDKMKEISLRTLITVSKIVATNPEGYEEFAEYLTV
jgi:hypothetical protein